MASFGSFQVDKEVYSDLVYAVYTARKRDDPSTDYAVKVFRLPDPGLEAEVAPGAGGREELERARLNSIAVQEQGAASSRFIAPIFEKGNDSRGLWYATRFYPRSVNRLMTGKVALPRASLEYIIDSIARGALDLQRNCGRSHGAIQPTNVQVGKGEKLTEAEVVLCDPLAGGPEEAVAYEINDLQAIGLILLQLVRQRLLNAEDVSVMLPISPSPEWTRVFGSDAGDWLAICNRLLDPNLSSRQFTLEQLVARLDELKPKPKQTPKWLIASAAAVVILVPLTLWLLRPSHSRDPVPAQVDAPAPPQVSIAPAPVPQTQPIQPAQPPPTPITVAERPVSQPANPQPAVTTGTLELRSESVAASVFDSSGTELGRVASDAPLNVSLPVGPHTLTARVPGLDDVVGSVSVEPGSTVPYSFKFAFGTVEWTSLGVPISISIAGRSQVTPATFIQKPDVAAEYVLAASGFQTMTNQVTLTNGERRTLPVRLLPLNVAVTLSSDPPGAQFFTENGQPLPRNYANQQMFNLSSGVTTVVARYDGLGSVTNRVEVLTDHALAPVSFKFPYGTLVLSNLPPDIAVYEGEARIGAASDKFVIQKLGTHSFALRGQVASQLVQTNIAPGVNFLTYKVSAEKAWKNSFGMWFAWVAGMHGGGVWPGQNAPGAWVGIVEVTQGQYKKMDGNNPSAFQDGGENYPVENLTYEQALAFCRWLSSADSSQHMGWIYSLPTEEQYTAFAADADRVPRITSEGRNSAPVEDSLPLQRMARLPTAINANSARTHPEPVASTKKSNQFGLYDVAGNVWEWLARTGAKENVCAGGSYVNFTQKTVGSKARELISSRSPTIGFRVILAPAQ